MEWGEFNYPPHMKARFKHCENCRNGVEGITCMADDDPDGLCPIADLAPTLWACNEIPVRVFNQAQNSARQVAARDKNYLYLRPDEIRTLMEMYRVPTWDQEEVMDRVRIIEEITNRVRPMYKKRTMSNPSGSRRRR